MSKSLKTLILLFFAIAFNSWSQENIRPITGKVIDAKTKEPLIGATILVKETFQGAITNMDGEFVYQLKGANIDKKVLVFSFLGFTPQEVKVGQKNYFEIALEPDVNSIAEVVVTSSYGTKKLKQDVVGSITSVKPQDLILEQAVTSFDQLLEGQAAGVLIETGEGLNSPSEIHIRGVGSLRTSDYGTSTQPLIIVDGVILAEETNIEGSNFFDNGGGTYSEDPNNPFAKLGINNIESINILKDAAAVSLYGADGANGVIIITTKSGSVGKTRINFRAQGGFSTELNAVKYMTGEQYREMLNLYNFNRGNTDAVQAWNGLNTDWHNLLNDNGWYQNYDFAISGGKGRWAYRAGLAYQDTHDAQIFNTLQRYNSNFSIAYRTKKLNISLKAAPSYSERNTPNTLADFALPPDMAPYDEQGNYTSFDTYGNPIAVAKQNRKLSKDFGLRNSISLNYKIHPQLNFSSLFGIDYGDKEQDTFNSGLNQTGVKGTLKGKRHFQNRQTNKWNWNAQLSYNKTFKFGNYFDALIGVETRRDHSKRNFSRGIGFEQFETPEPIVKAKELSYDEDSSEKTGRSIYSQFNYDFRKRYYLLVNTRIDQSSAFGGDNNTAINSGLGLSWVISNENFLKDQDWIQLLRIKTSYGTTGNSRIGSYRALGLYSYSDTERGGYNQQTGSAEPYSLPNPKLGWETNRKFNTGMDFDLKRGISFTLEYYYDDISDMIVSRDAIPETGLGNVQINGAEMYNRGWEFSISANIIQRNHFRWRSSFNINTLDNKVTSLRGLGSEFSHSTAATAEKVGYPSTLLWGYNFIGIDPATGRELYKMGDGNLVDALTLKSQYNGSNNYIPIGDSQPKVYGGLSNRLTIFKNLTVSANFSYKIGADHKIQKELIDQYQTLVTRNMANNAYYDAWRKPGDLAKFQALAINPTISNSSKYVYDASNIKLNSANISYRLSNTGWKTIKSLNLTATGSNLYYWYFSKSEEGKNGIKELYKIYPETRTVTLGVDLRF